MRGRNAGFAVAPAGADGIIDAEHIVRRAVPSVVLRRHQVFAGGVGIARIPMAPVMPHQHRHALAVIAPPSAAGGVAPAAAGVKRSGCDHFCAAGECADGVQAAARQLVLRGGRHGRRRHIGVFQRFGVLFLFAQIIAIPRGRLKRVHQFIIVAAVLGD